jgi:mRNA deadenylase 3'-5' endonuclease subunit Ccr4
VHKYDIKPSMELYEKHYIFWANWHSKILAELGKNFKNDIRCMQEIVGNLDDMYSLLNDEEGEKLRPHIEDIKKAKAIIDERNMTTSNETRIRRILERENRVIEREFTPRKMQGSIREDWRANGENYD